MCELQFGNVDALNVSDGSMKKSDIYWREQRPPRFKFPAKMAPEKGRESRGSQGKVNRVSALYFWTSFAIIIASLAHESGKNKASIN